MDPRANESRGDERRTTALAALGGLGLGLALGVAIGPERIRPAGSPTAAGPVATPTSATTAAPATTTLAAVTSGDSATGKKAPSIVSEPSRSESRDERSSADVE